MSRRFKGCYYQFQTKVGEGGSGKVYTVLLRDMRTDIVKNIYAGKVVLESYLLNKNTEKRRENLNREIEMLKLAEKASSVTLVELISKVDRTVLIQDYANGGSLCSLMNTRGTRGFTLSEVEIQKVVKLLTSSLNMLY